MNDELIKRIDSLERQFSGFFASMRMAVLLLVLLTAVRSYATLSRAPEFKTIFEEMLNGASFPVATNFVINYHVPLCGILVILSGLSTLGLIYYQKYPRAIPFGIITIIINLSIGELAWIALTTPIQDIIARLSEG
jgi:hypothetical protein